MPLATSEFINLMKSFLSIAIYKGYLFVMLQRVAINLTALCMLYKIVLNRQRVKCLLEKLKYIYMINEQQSQTCYIKP